jgi:hypothetical protein
MEAARKRRKQAPVPAAVRVKTEGLDVDTQITQTLGAQLVQA